jgi:small neutral amino acid transporter SnatA (MarC family)
MTGAAQAGLVAILFAVLIYLFTQDGTLTAGGAFFIFLGTTTHLALGLLLGVAAVWMAFQTRG